MLPALTRLEDALLDGNPFGPPAMAALAAGLQSAPASLRCLYLSSCFDREPNAMLATLAPSLAHTAIHTLALDDNGITDMSPLFALVPQLPLRALNLGRNRFTDPLPADLGQLESLNLAWCSLPEASFQPWEHVLQSQLQMLNLTGNALHNTHFLSTFLLACPGLTELTLDNCNLPAAAMQGLVAALPSYVRP